MPTLKLVLECSASESGFILKLDEEIISSGYVNRHSDLLFSTHIPKALAECDYGPKDIDLIVWSQGPGSFTGIRICATWIQSIAYIHAPKVIGICSLRGRAQLYCERNNLQEGCLKGFLKANHKYCYHGTWSILNGVVSNAMITVGDMNKIKLTHVDLNMDEAFVKQIDALSFVTNSEEIISDPFLIRPSYFFNQFQ